METNKEVYNDRICKYCKHKDTCSKDKFTVFRNDVKTSITCIDYEYTYQQEPENVFVLK